MDKKIEVKCECEGTPYAPVVLDPDDFLDDLINRFEGCEPALGDDAMRRTVGFFQHRIWFCVSCYLFPQ
jgi:hypothetical protein